MRRLRSFAWIGLAPWCLAAAAGAQSLNVDFGAPATGPSADYGAAGPAGVWNAIPAAHGTTTEALVGLDGVPTGVSITQIGGLALHTVNDPAVDGDDALLMDDYLVTFSSTLESCIHLDDLQPGEYVVLVYARMPDGVALSYTSVEDEPGFPHYSVGGPWPGAHAELVSFSRHRVTVGPGGDLDLHSGIVPGHDPLAGAALNALQVVLLVEIFGDGFESGGVGGWDG